MSILNILNVKIFYWLKKFYIYLSVSKIKIGLSKISTS